MSSTPTSFASAAAGQSRLRPGENGEWHRRDGRSANGTMTFRRSSTAPTSQHSQSTHDSSPAALPPVAESLPTQVLPPFDGSFRYSRDQMLNIYKGISLEALDVSTLLSFGWNSAQVNGSSRGWGKTSEGTIPQDPTVCWEAAGCFKPVGLQDMTSSEKEVFADVNSTIKPQQQKDSGQGGGAAGGSLIPNGRKTSVSHGSGYNTAQSASAISASRPAAQRRETSDNNPFPSGTGSGSGGVVSPSFNRTARDESWFGRRNADTKEQQLLEELVEENAAKISNLGSVGQNNGPGSSSGLGTPASLWSAPGPTPGTMTGVTIGSAMGAFGSFSLPATMGEKRFGSMRGESRLAHLIPKQDALDAATKQPGSVATGANAKEPWRPRPRTDTDPFSEDGGAANGSVIGGNTDTPLKNANTDFGMSELHSGGHADKDTAASPETNPFGSPPSERVIDEKRLRGVSALTGMAGAGGSTAAVSENAVNFSSLRGYPANAFDGSDRSQTSSVGAKGFPSLANIPGWGNPMVAGTPDRDRSTYGAFGSSLFNPVAGELQSPGFGGIVTGSSSGGVFGAPSLGGTGGSLRTGASKLGSLFPANLQTQVAGGQDQEGGLNDSVPELRQINPLGAIGREAVGYQIRDADSGNIRSARALFEDNADSSAASVGTGSVFTTDQQSQPGLLASSSSPLPQSQAFDSGLRPSMDTPPNAPRTMVMPDRMRWVYLDPQGQTQGPFTGLEMNDWYKANFFTADLRVKKVEDTEFEPLGQLIRRIGNSREPFLVPQMGIAHGQPSLSGTFAHGDRGTVIPPLVGAFPSYGRTLTAEEQNNLERRKQEEQYMLARQRELMAVQHHPFPAGRVPGAPGVPGAALHHHSSAHSLHSQPSYSSIASPLATAPPPMLGGLGTTPGFFDHTALPSTTIPPVNSGSDYMREDVNPQERQLLSDLQHPTEDVANIFSQKPSHEPAAFIHLPTTEQLQKDPQGISERLKEFEQLRSQMDASDYAPLGVESLASVTTADPSDAVRHQQSVAEEIAEDVALKQHAGDSKKVSSNGEEISPLPSLSLTQQVQNTQAAVAAAQWRAVYSDVPSETSHTDLPMPFPPPQIDSSATPLAAPTAQRTRSTLPEQYATSRSQSETPESATAGSSTVQPPPLAPWARELGAESHRGPSLKEIQEAEAKKAAEAEEAAAAARKSALEHEVILLREREKASAALAPGLPTTSTWGSGTPSAVVPPTPWAKPSTGKAGVSSLSGGNSSHSSTEKKKSLDEIQREEEARKQKSKELSGQALISGTPGGGKRYADLASRAQLPAVPSVSTASPTVTVVGPSSGSGWSTVGAGGKVKGSIGAAGRSVSSAMSPAKPSTTVPGSIRSTPRPLPGSADNVSGGIAMDEFNKWLQRELSRGVSDGLDVKSIMETLLQLPMDQSIISEVVYASSKTMDGRHFAEEFVRRKKLADKGVVEKQSSTPVLTDAKGGGGWSEVAKKGGQNKEEGVSAGFKVVPGRKKGRK